MPFVAHRDTDDVIRLDDNLDFLQALWALDHAMQTASKTMRRTLKVTGPQRLVLRIVSKNPHIGAGAIARTLHLHPSTLTGVLSRLVERGLLEREADDTDARRARFVVTPKAQTLIEARAGTVEHAVQELLAQEPSARIATVRVVVDELTRLLGKASAAKK